MPLDRTNLGTAAPLQRAKHDREQGPIRGRTQTVYEASRTKRGNQSHRRNIVSWILSSVACVQTQQVCNVWTVLPDSSARLGHVQIISATCVCVLSPTCSY